MSGPDIDPADFILAATAESATSTPIYSPRSMGTRFSLIEAAFFRHCGHHEGLVDALDELIQGGKVVAVSLTWGKEKYKHSRTCLASAKQLYSFPDRHAPEKDPMLYLPDKIPLRVKQKIGRRAEKLLSKVLKRLERGESN